MAFGIDMGPSAGEQSQYGSLTSSSGFATGEGEGDITASDAFMRALLSGDPTKISQVLAPQISAAKTSAAQNTKTQTQFGGRTGGTAARNAATNDTLHSDITNLIGSTTAGAASSLGSEGTGLLGEGMSGEEAGFGEADKMQQQRAAKWNDLFNSVGSAAEGAATFFAPTSAWAKGLNAFGGAAQQSAGGY
jgi:hypothetical protein